MDRDHRRGVEHPDVAVTPRQRGDRPGPHLRETAKRKGLTRDARLYHGLSRALRPVGDSTPLPAVAGELLNSRDYGRPDEPDLLSTATGRRESGDSDTRRLSDSVPPHQRRNTSGERDGQTTPLHHPLLPAAFLVVPV